MELLVVADDRTGALETAGALADAGFGPVPVRAWAIGPGVDDAVAVVDLGTRQLDESQAAELAAAVDDVPATRHAHKIDSTLRGNWAVELVARSGRPVLVVAALPALGRTCRGGVVLVDGVPVHESASAFDIGGRALTTSRPADLLARAGASDVDELDGLGAAARWLASPDGIAVCDATTDDDLDAITASWAAGTRDVLLAGTAAVIGTAGAHVLPRRAISAAPPPPLRAPVLVVCGSAHPAAAAQLTRLAADGVAIVVDVDDAAVERLAADGVLVVRAPAAFDAITPASARATAVRLAAHVDELAGGVDIGTLVVLGGDTAAAVLGARTVDVGGTIGPGAPWGRIAGGGPLVVTRSGGFGGPDALAELLAAAH